MRILSVGEVLWDVIGGEAVLGGAPLNFVYHARRLGHDVAIASAIGDDALGRRALAFMQSAGIDSQFVGVDASLPTGTVTVQVTSAGQPSYRFDRPAAYDRTVLSPGALDTVAAWRPDVVYFGNLFSKAPVALDTLQAVLAACRSALRFYDVNLRGGETPPEAIRTLAPLANILKLSEEEAPLIARALGVPETALDGLARRLAAAFGYRAVCVTRGEQGCLILSEDEVVECPGYRVAVVDTVGSGDAFAAAFLHGWASGWGPKVTGDFANRVGGLVAGRRGGTPAWSPEELTSVAASARIPPPIGSALGSGGR
jgi:fructokinase